MFSSVLFIALALFGLLYALRRRQECFRIHILDTEIKIISGQPPPELLQFCQQLIQDMRNIKGNIRGLKKDERIELICSHSIPIAYRQDIYLFWMQQRQADGTCLGQLPTLLK